MRSNLVCTFRTVARALLVVVVLGLPACAGGGGGGGSGGSGDMITRDEIAASGAQSAWEVVQRYRSRWVRPARNQNVSSTATVGSVRGGSDGDAFPAGSQEYAVVFYDGRYFGEIDSLMSFDPAQVEYIEYIDARRATTLYGTGYAAGVINVMPRTGIGSSDAQ